MSHHDPRSPGSDTSNHESEDLADIARQARVLIGQAARLTGRGLRLLGGEASKAAHQMMQMTREASLTAGALARDAVVVTTTAIGQATAVAGDAIASTEWVRSINGHWDHEPLVRAITQAMDKGFQIGQIDPESGMTIVPNNHRILIDGHTPAQSLTEASQVSAEFGAEPVESTIAWLKAYFEDLSSPAGMPSWECSKDVYVALCEAGWDERTVREFVTTNGSDVVDGLLAAPLSALSVFLVWTNQERETFSRAVGALGMASILTLNPVVGLVTLVSAAIAYKRELISKSAIHKGMFIKLAGFSVSILMPGPALVTAICGIVLAVYLNRRIDRDRPLSDQIAAVCRSARAAAEAQIEQLRSHGSGPAPADEGAR